MRMNDRVQELTKQMEEIYEADRDYEICLADLSEEDQKKYADLKKERAELLK